MLPILEASAATLNGIPKWPLPHCGNVADYQNYCMRMKYLNEINMLQLLIIYGGCHEVNGSDRASPSASSCAILPVLTYYQHVLAKRQSSGSWCAIWCDVSIYNSRGFGLGLVARTHHLVIRCQQQRIHPYKQNHARHCLGCRCAKVHSGVNTKHNLFHQHNIQKYAVSQTRCYRLAKHPRYQLDSTSRKSH